MKALCQTTALAKMLTIPVLRNPFAYAFMFLFPGMFLYLYWLIGGMNLGKHVLFGSLVGSTMNSGIVSLPQKVLEYRLRKLQDMYVASPVNQVVYLFGHGLSRLLYALPGTLIFIIILVSAGYMPIRALPSTIVVLLLSWASGCAIGFTLTTYVTNAAQMSAVANALGLLILLIPPVLYPLELIQPRWRWAALMLPSSSAAQLMKIESGISFLNGEPYVLICWSVLGLYVVLSLLIVIKKSRWREI